MRTLYLTDLDGTLLGPDGLMPDELAARVRALIDDGMLIAYSTARSFLSAHRVVSGCGFTSPGAVYGGALLVAATDGAILERRVLGAATTGAILDLCRHRGLPPLVYALDGDRDTVSWVDSDRSGAIDAYLAVRGEDPRFRPRSRWGGLPTSDAFYVSVIGDAQPMAAFARDLEELLGTEVSAVLQKDLYIADETWLEISAPGADKATAALALRDRVGADQLVCFGDNLIDLPMFRVADHAVAVANAVDEVRAAADVVIGANSAGAVVDWLEREWSG